MAFQKSHVVWKLDYVSGVLGVLVLFSFVMQFPAIYGLCGFEDAQRTLGKNDNP